MTAGELVTKLNLVDRNADVFITQSKGYFLSGVGCVKLDDSNEELGKYRVIICEDEDDIRGIKI